ncbi:MAG: 3-deoxy-7-phosphoheptulonate synthase [Clostridium argentinense]|uniref:3-deoxy-7-phosphoheptulonate synthase n=1 Tax=Clostridium faecium TaxID=2762223 RepID=A0ABR8YQG1_9CLOT|nr:MULTISPECIES: 3-deoxy-7-phosphoheptulonate synthase [Clostridium]MBD8046480.1 3-deoxy-7-phosphoheptulonate synthase [Clostridium faecium]MBS5823200.1 3-deoxy-7-phosphoheptulonate synthase [Clostridium argentinense]MDU1348994.1 3-deoxy-7-phosphoheptulonate synthase [Clostridium argentinense]
MENLLVENNSGPKIIVKVKDITIGEKEKVIISGPCSVENYDIMKTIAKELKNMGVHILRGGAFKPRTSPYDFQGLKYEGVKILHEVGKEFNMPIVTEIMDARDIEKCIDYIDMIQVGSRNMYNYTLLKELGNCKLPILLKRGMSATLAEWLNAAEYIMSSGNKNIVLCERGVRTFETYTRNTLDLNAVAVVKERCRIPIIVDPSHGTGRRELVERMSLAGIAAGADGVMIESHIYPDKAISDSKQTVSMDTMRSIVSKINEIKDIF